MPSRQIHPCEQIRPIIQSQVGDAYDRFKDIEKFEMYGLRLDSPEYQRLKRQYLVSIMNLYLALERTSATCPMGITPVLYFWPDNSDCPTCATFVYQLEEIKKDCPDVRVFAFPSNPANFEPVDALQKKFNVKASPALVIGKSVIETVTDTSELRRLAQCPNPS